MRKLMILALSTVALVSTAGAQVGDTPPEIEAVKWYNTPPLALEQMLGKAVLVEVFRTW